MLDEDEKLKLCPTCSKYRATLCRGQYHLLDMEELKIIRIGVGYYHVLKDIEIIRLMERILPLLGVEVKHEKTHVRFSLRASIFKCPPMSIYALIFGTFNIYVEPLGESNIVYLRDLPIIARIGTLLIYVDECRIIPIPDNSNIYKILRIGSLMNNVVGVDDTLRQYPGARIVVGSRWRIVRTCRRDLVSRLSRYASEVVDLGNGEHVLYFSNNVNIVDLVEKVVYNVVPSKLEVL